MSSKEFYAATEAKELEPEQQQDGDGEDDDEDNYEDQPIHYRISAVPNDFNVETIYNTIESGSLTIPGFHYHYIWDIDKASKLIESILRGFPVPQIFWYEQSLNKFIVIDGQQRLMTIYYFIKMRFPRMDKRGKLRMIYEREGRVSDEVLADNEYFSDFDLKLGQKQLSSLSGCNYETLGELEKNRFNHRPIRNIIVKALSPSDDDFTVFEIFNRLNSIGSNSYNHLSHQEIRMRLYNSKFMDMLARVNTEKKCRKLFKTPDPDMYMKDIEILLRCFAMLIRGDEYEPSMMEFLNKFAKDAKSNKTDYSYAEDTNEGFDSKKIAYLETLFYSFLKSCSDLSDNAFYTPKGNFMKGLFESVFTAACEKAYLEETNVIGKIVPQSVDALKTDDTFLSYSNKNVKARLSRAKEIIKLKLL
ncbi:protein of unknown function DUF262 [Candidatus Magnetoovum chiemensis]|nr:protein of unknown function DUF262 [Candidatus Magnetoovum chiemensis]